MRKYCYLALNKPYLPIHHVSYKVKKSLFDHSNDEISPLVQVPSVSTAQIQAVIILGTRQIPSTTTVINDNLLRIQFLPQEPGLYSIHVSCANQAIEGNRSKTMRSYAKILFDRITIFHSCGTTTNDSNNWRMFPSFTCE